MKDELPEEFDTARGWLRYSTMDTGDRYLVFAIEPEDFDRAMAGEIVGMIIPADVDKQHLDQVLGEIRDLERFPITRGHSRQQRNSFRIPLV